MPVDIGFTIQGLARRCGLTNGGLLYHVGSKEQLLVSMLEERDRREAEIIPAGLRFHSPAVGETRSRLNVLRIFRAIAERSAAQPELLRRRIVLQAEAMNHEHPAYDCFLRRESMVLDEFTKILGSRSQSPRSTARLVLAVMQGLEQQWIRADHEFDLAAECGHAIALILPSMRAARR